MKLSWGLPLYQDVKNSIPYAYATIRPVSNMTLHMLSMCRGVMSALSPNRLRAGMASVRTIAKPPKMAPATK